MKLVNLRHLTQKQDKTSYFNVLRISRKLRHLRHKHGKTSYFNGNSETYYNFNELRSSKESKRKTSHFNEIGEFKALNA